MGSRKYTTEFKVEATCQVIDHGHPVGEVVSRLGVSIDSMYLWVREQRKAPATQQADNILAVENRRLLLKHEAQRWRRQANSGG